MITNPRGPPISCRQLAIELAARAAVTPVGNDREVLLAAANRALRRWQLLPPSSAALIEQPENRDPDNAANRLHEDRHYRDRRRDLCN
jgi:hypothetical protein